MTDTIQTETNVLASREIFVPLNKLKKSPRNARKVPHGEAAIEALAASIHHKGLIQNLVVEPEMKGDKPTGSYLVTAGEGRRLAYLLRAKRRQIRKSMDASAHFQPSARTSVAISRNCSVTSVSSKTASSNQPP